MNSPEHGSEVVEDSRRLRRSAIARGMDWVERLDQGGSRRIKGLRLVSAYAIAVLVGALPGVRGRVAHGVLLSFLAGGFALWASVSEGKETKGESCRDLVILCGAATIGALMMIGLAPLLSGHGRPGPEMTLVTGAFFVGYLKRFGILGAGIGSQIYIGQFLAYSAGLKMADLELVGVAGLLSVVASVVPRLFSDVGAHERPAPHVAVAMGGQVAAGGLTGFVMGLQAAVAALAIVGLNDVIGLEESAWAITTCTYVIGNSRASTMDRIRRRVLGTLIGVPIGLAFVPLAVHAPVVVWSAAAIAMIIYSMALPERYDVACAAYAFTLMVTMAATGDRSVSLLAARIWETLIGGIVGVVVVMLIVPRSARENHGAAG
jgi:hypothetical protein